MFLEPPSAKRVQAADGEPERCEEIEKRIRAEAGEYGDIEQENQADIDECPSAPDRHGALQSPQTGKLENRKNEQPCRFAKRAGAKKTRFPVAGQISVVI